jgi:dienelactone hydrolase
MSVFEHAAKPTAGCAVARFRGWRPAGGGRVRAVVVLTPGSNIDGRGAVGDPAWRRFARANGAALLGCHFADARPRQREIYTRAELGGGPAMLAALAAWAKEEGEATLAAAPLLLWGHSAGGQFNHAFALWRPARVGAFVVNKGGYYGERPPSAAAVRVPGLFIIGGEDLPRRARAIRRIFAAGRARGAAWVLACEPGAGHEERGAAALARVFFRECLARREPAAGVTGAQAWVDRDVKTEWMPGPATRRAWARFTGEGRRG